MRIAQIPPLYEPLPPQRYGGTERVVAYLVEELVRRGHDVTVFGTGDSITSARLVPICEQALHFDSPQVDPCGFHVLQLGVAYERACEFDVIHAHVDFRALAFAGFVTTPTVSTNHNRLDAPESVAFLQRCPGAMITTLSNSQRSQVPTRGVCWLGTVYNGIPLDQFPFVPRPGRYLAYLGRLSPDKGPDDAIRVAQITGIPLRIAGKVNLHEREYFERVLRPLIAATPHVEFVGEVTDAEKAALLGDALALLAPARWPEPFGLAAIEAMACGTPVIARPAGALPEIIVDGVTGFFATTPEAMAASCAKIPLLSRSACRRRVEYDFSVETMVDGYEKAYLRAIALTRARAGSGRTRLAG